MEFYDTSQLTPELAQRNYATALLRLNPNGKAPLLALSGAAKKRYFRGIGHTYATKTAEFTSVTPTAAIDNAGTTLVVSAADGAKIIPNMIFQAQDPVNPTNVEHIIINSQTNATTFEVTRGFGGTTARTGLAAIAIGELLVHVGNAHEQGSLPPKPRSIGTQLYTNYTQIFRNAYGTTRTLAAIGSEFGINNAAENKEDCMWMHAVDIETAVLFGRKSPAGAANHPTSMATRNGRPITTMNGIEATIAEFAPQNIYSAGATTTFDQLESMLDPLLDFQTNISSSNDRLIYTGAKGMKVINDIGKLEGVLNHEPEDSVFGQRFREFKTTRGNFMFMEHPLLNTNPQWARMAFVMDFSAFDFYWLRDTTTEAITGTGRDEEAGVMTSELTLQLQTPHSCAVIHNLTAAA